MMFSIFNLIGLKFALRPFNQIAMTRRAIGPPVVRPVVRAIGLRAIPTAGATAADAVARSGDRDKFLFNIQNGVSSLSLSGSSVFRLAILSAPFLLLTFSRYREAFSIRRALRFLGQLRFLEIHLTPVVWLRSRY
jgi:hypothetical protein